jgi:protein-S-isoprenylcysteine O-methyltransferase Ste14
MEISALNQKTPSDLRRGRIRWTMQMIAGLVLFAAILFLTAGHLDWFGGWAFLTINGITQMLSALLLSARQPEMLAERSGAQKGTKNWDKVLAPAIMIVGSLVLIITAGLDARFGWSSGIGAGLQMAALFVAFASQMFVLWAMASNPFFVTTVRIQTDRDHNAVSQGPYRLVRHPGYLGSMIYTLAAPLVLGSWWTFIPAAVTVLLIIVRTALEDKTLQAELSGYSEYVRTVQFRLIPGVW